MPFSVVLWGLFITLLHNIVKHLTLTDFLHSPISISFYLKTSTSTFVPTTMALNIPPLSRPEYLIGVTTENAVDNSTNGALRIFEFGRLSKAPCSLVIIS